MKVTTVLDNQIEITGHMWFVTMTDKLLSGWGCAENKIAKRVIICETLQQALQLKDRADRPVTRMKYINVVSSLPKYPSTRYVVSYDKYKDSLFNY